MKLSKNSIDAMVDRIAFACQCDNPIVREINGDTILMMDVHDSDCEYYIEEYGIYQDEVDGKTYNCVNLSRLSKGVRKHRMLSKNIDGVRKSSLVNVRSASISNFTLNGETVNVFLTDDGVYVGLRSNYDNQGHYDNSDNSLLYISSLENTFGAMYGSGWADTYEEMAQYYTTMPSPEEVNRVRDYLARLGYQEQRIQTFGDGKGWDDYRASTRKSVQSFSTVLDSVRKSANIGKAQLSDDYPNHSEGTFVVHRKVNYESMYPQRFDNREDYESFCRELESKGWTRGREYVDNDGAEVTYFRDTD